MDADAGCAFDNRTCLRIDKNGGGGLHNRQEPVLDFIRSNHLVESVGVHVGIGDNLTSVCQHGVCGSGHRGDGCCSGRSVPLLLGSQSLVIGLLPSAVRVIIVDVAHAVGFDGDAGLTSLGSQKLPHHTLRNDACASDKLCGIIVDTIDNICRKLLIGSQNRNDLAAVFLINVSALTEERHIGLGHLNALTSTERSLSVEHARLQRNANALVTTQPLQFHADLFASREQGIRSIGLRIGRVIRPVGGNRSRGEDFIQIQCHNLVLLTRSFRQHRYGRKRLEQPFSERQYRLQNR